MCAPHLFHLPGWQALLLPAAGLPNSVFACLAAERYRSSHRIPALQICISALLNPATALPLAKLSAIPTKTWQCLHLEQWSRKTVLL
jgi:hypothetical protein